MPLIEATRFEEKHLQDIADTIASSHKVLIVTGAGISTSIGIPDFRSKDGLYNLIPEQTLPSPPPSRPSTPSKQRFSSPVSTPSRKRKAAEALDEDDELPPSSQSSSSSRRSSVTPSKRLKGQDLFDSRIFNSAEGTTTFYRFIASLREKIHDDVQGSSMTHKFIRVLRDGGRLMRCYTQNIDGLEAREGLVMDLKRGRGNKRRFMKKHWAEPRREQPRGTDHDGGCEVVQLHGDLDTLRCSVCSTQWTWTENETEIFMDGFAPRCKKCARKSDDRQATGKRGLAVGSLRPNIVLYGEDHPQNSLLSPFVPFDAGSQPEVLIIMGTSLKVFGLQKIVREFAKAVHAQKNGKVIFVNRTKPAESVWDNFIDYFVPMDCDEWVENLRSRRSDIWLRQGELDLKVTKKTPVKRKRASEDGHTDKDTRPTKKQKIPIIEIPPKRSTAPLTPRRAEELRQRILIPLALVRNLGISPNTETSSHTPQGPKATALPDTSLSASPKRPPFSPLTPKGPMFSPLTPMRHHESSLRNEVKAHYDLGFETPESDEEKENHIRQPSIEPDDEIDTITVTPSKVAPTQKISLRLGLCSTASPAKTRSTVHKMVQEGSMQARSPGLFSRTFAALTGRS